MPLFDHFKIIAPFYDNVFGSGNHEKLFEFVNLPVQGFLIDAGGGTGRISQYLKDDVEHLVVVDQSFDMLKQASVKRHLITTCSLTEHLPLADETITNIIMVDALHHVCNQEETANELWRVLEVGGRIIIEEPDIRKFGVKLLAIGEKLLGMRSHFLSPTKIANLFDKFASIKIETEPPIAWVIIEKPEIQT